MKRNPAATAAAIEAARSKTSGRFGEQPAADPGQLQLVPEPPQKYLKFVWAAINRQMTAGRTQPTSIAALRSAIAADLPGLTDDQIEWFTSRTLEYADAWLRCDEVLHLPQGATWDAINARIPKGLQRQVPKTGFRVRDDSNFAIDSRGEASGQSFTRYGTNEEWVEALADHCGNEIAILTARARATSDEIQRLPRVPAHGDPWVGYNDNPPF